VLEKPQRKLTLAPPSVLNEEEDEVNIEEGGEDGRRRIFLTKEAGAQQSAGRHWCHGRCRAGDLGLFAELVSEWS
jgi:hypothetical protein